MKGMENLKRDGLSRLLDTNELEHWYQPIVHLETGEIIGQEALLRHKSKEGLSPTEIFDQARKNGLLNWLDIFSIKKALINSSSIEHPLFINVFPSTLISYNFLKEWDRMLKPRMSIVVELCKSEDIYDWDALKKVIKELKERQVKIAIGDFGGGHSFFSQWVELDPNYIKINKCFANNLSTSIKKQTIIKHLLLFVDMNTKLVLKGIETNEDLNMAISLGIDYGQGYNLGKPMPENSSITEMQKNIV